MDLHNKTRKRIWVDEGLYDFTDEELQLIYKSRVSKDKCNFENKVGSEIHNGKNEEQDEDSDQKECSSDTESTIQWVRDHFNEGFLEEDDRDDRSSSNDVMSLSSLSQFQSYFTETDYDFEHAKDDIMSAIKKPNLLTNASPENQIVHLSVKNKKRIVPEPWLSDPYHVDSDESLDERDNQSYFTPTSYIRNLRSRISSARTRLMPNLFAKR